MKKICFTLLGLVGVTVSLQAQINLSGQILSVNDRPISQVRIEVLSPDDELVGTFITGPDGQYAFNNLPETSRYFLRISRDVNYLDGVSTFDIVSISRHILGVEPFQNPYQVIASDVNLTRSITTLDLVEMRRLVLGMVDVFPTKEHWIFIPDQIPAGNPGQILSALKELIEVPVTNQVVRFDLKGIKLGDVNFSATIN